jgi:hypothetical protein
MIIEMNTRDFSFTNVTKENFSYVNKLLGNNAWEECRELLFFPKDEISAKINDVCLAQLLYLASFTENTDKCPFTENQKQTLKDGHYWSATTTWSLRVCLLIITGIITAVALVPIYPIASDNSNSTSNSTETSGLTPSQNGLMAYAIIAGVISNMFSFWATGFSPNYLSIASNSSQDVLVGIHIDYTNISARLIRLYCSENGKDEAKKIAENLSSKYLFKKCFHYTQNEERTGQIMSDLRQAVRYIISDEQILPESYALMNTIDIQKKLH